jgi:signal transduction histidine kinase
MERYEKETRLMQILPDLGIQLGQVVARTQLERQVANATVREQRRLGADIHDGVGQELTGLKYLAQTHAESLAKQALPEATVAERIADGLEAMQKQMREVIRDLVPVEVDEKGLSSALSTLAKRTLETYGIPCRFECDQPVAIEDHLLATHIYRIVQEAVNNAVQHAKARVIIIRLTELRDDLQIEVIDDGVGIHEGSDTSSGFGLRTMAHRAKLIGARLDIDPSQTGGTIVRCTVAKDELL